MTQPHKEVVDEPPPFLGTWPRVYGFVLIFLALVIVLFWMFAEYYAPAA